VHAPCIWTAAHLTRLQDRITASRLLTGSGKWEWNREWNGHGIGTGMGMDMGLLESFARVP